MNYGFIKVAAATPKIKVADCEYNAREICKNINRAYNKGVKLIVFPELCITGYTCEDLFWQSSLLESAKNQMFKIASYIENKNIMAVIGLPIEFQGKLYNCAAVLFGGEVQGIVPKSYLPNHSEFYELRHFESGKDICGEIEFDEDYVSFGTELIFKATNIPDFQLAIEICEDLWVPNPPSSKHATSGATIIANLSASNEITGKDVYRKSLVSNQSARLISAYIYADAGEGESSTDLVFAGHNIICENGTVLAESKRFINQMVISDIDLDRLKNERRKTNTFGMNDESGYEVIEFEFDEDEDEEININRIINKSPFVPNNKEQLKKRCEEIFTIQAMGLKKRLEHTKTKTAIVGVSGGLDSTLALLVVIRAFDYLKLSRDKIIAVTMPGFGTTDRTYNNALQLAKQLGVTLREINISKAVTQHFTDIGHDISVKDVTYENSQARQRTYLLMDIANQNEGLVIGTGDLSELALGWATYNGDHMSMYGVNSSVPKTLVRYLVKYYADICEDKKISIILKDVLNTPVSPELLPPDEKGDIVHKTEDVVGPYELHDFFLYYMMRYGYEPKKILFLAENAFDGVYERETIVKWLRVFYKRFFSQQFKRSCLPDGPKVGSVSVSPRGDLRMPSDACAREWLNQIS